MTKRIRKKPSAPNGLRSEAEARLVMQPLRRATSLPAEEVLHELHIHQIELEMQNEQLRLAQAGLEEARDLYLDLYEFAPVGYLILTGTGHIADINLTGARLLGMERKDALARSFDEFVVPDDVERWRGLFTGLGNTDELMIEEMRLRSSGDAIFPAQVGCRRREAVDTMPAVVRLVLIDLSAVKTTAEKHHRLLTDFDMQAGMLIADDERIRRLAFHDFLTDLPNRRLMIDRLHHAMTSAARTRKYCAVLFIDLDNFKTINDSLGHDIGDQLLQQVAQRLSACVREGDTVARHGGDEFVVILENLSDCPDESANRARSIGEKIVSALNQPYPLAGHEHASSASIGAALSNNPQDTAEELLKRADMAMYDAKSAGGNTVRFFDPAMQALVTARATMEAELRRALESCELECHFQQQMDDAGRIPGAEVLLRWQHPQRGLMFPADFIRVAEETGQLVTIGHWVLETACARIKAWQDARPARNLHLAVNISTRQFRQPGFVAGVRAALEKTGIDPGGLVLEFRESTLLGDLAGSIAKMEALKKLGVRLAMDDFGMGCSSLSQLTQLPLDQLKIDPILVRDIGVKLTDEVIVQTLIDMARHLGMEVLAEGVETEAQYAFLGEHGCHAFQGYLFGKPLPEREFEQLLSNC